VLLADLGADVVKIETAEGDPFRLAVYGFVGWNRGKRSLVLDLKRPEGRALFLHLAACADVVVDNFRPGVMERLGIGWETLAASNPRLIHTAITGYGPQDPLPGFDPVFQARSGLMQAQGGDDEPVFHSIAYSDYSAGTLAALATVAALVARERTGRGQRVDVSLFRAALTAQAAEMVLASGTRAGAAGGRDFRGPHAARRLYRCTDGWVCVRARRRRRRRSAGWRVSPSGSTIRPTAPRPSRSQTASARRRARRRSRASRAPASPRRPSSPTTSCSTTHTCGRTAASWSSRTRRSARSPSADR
jgi:crotonobetainyl-CoA:carnitine CoA-transferase CaiB-like acyl-CoA transferase